MKKRVLAVLLCLLCAMLLLVACGDNNTDTDNQGNNTNNQGHVHTYETNEAWSKDAQGHWYDATCDCEDAPITKLNHTDANNDGACDVCTFTNHEHEYTEDWTADCTNHWNAADCGHTVVGINIGAHVDEDVDGKCDVCNYIIEDLHNHYFATEWSSDTEYHWHAAVCEHKVEVADKAAHVINDAGICTVCDVTVKEIDKTNILAILAAAVASNNKVVTGDVKLEEIVYDGSEANNTLTVLNSAVTGAYFVLGDGQSYYFLKNYNKNGDLIGGEQQWFETLADGSVFGVKMDVNKYTLDPIDGDPAKLSGYTYLPGSILAAGYDDTNTLAQTLYNFYDLMSKGVNVSDATENYDAETGMYTFSFTYFTVNENTSGGEVYDTQLALYETSISFRIDNNFVINLANFEVKVYNFYDGGNVENDLVYDKETNTMSKTASANPSYYKYQVHQTSGERTFTSPYPKASLVPLGFDFSYVTSYEFPSAVEWVIYSEELIGDVLTLEAGTYAYFHLGNPVPSTTDFKFIDTSDFKFTFVNNDPNSDHRAWYMDPGSTDAMINTYSAYIGCLKLKMRDAGEYTVTISFGELTKTFTLIITAEPETEVSYNPETNKVTVALTDFNTYDNEDQTLTFTATEEGNYTFTVPAGLGVRLDGEDYPKVDLYDNGGTFTVGLNAGESVKIYFASYEYEVFYVDVAYAYADIPDPVLPDPEEPGEDGAEINIIGTYTANGLTIVIDEENVTFTTSKGYSTVCPYEIKDGKAVLYNSYNGSEWSSSMIAVNIANGAVESVVYNGNSYTVTKEVEEEEEVDNSKYETVIVAGSNTLYFSEAEITADAATRKVTITVAGNYSFSSGSLFVKSVTDAAGNTYAKNEDYTITLQPGEYYANFSMLSMFGVAADSAQTLNLENKAPISGGEDDGDDEADALKDSLHLWMPNNGTYDFMFLTTGGEYVVNIYNSNFDMYFTYELEDNGDGSYNMTVAYTEKEGFDYNETYATIVESTVFVLYYDGVEWTMEGAGNGGEEVDPSIDPIKEAVAGTYVVSGYEMMVYNSYTDGYLVNVYGEGFDLYFTFEVTINDDGTYTLDLTYLSRPDFESGTDKVDAILALDVTITPSSEPDVVQGSADWPFSIDEAGEYYAYFPGGYDPIWFAYNVPANGYITISTAYANPWFQYGTDIMYVANNQGPDGILQTVTFYAFAGETVYISVGDYDFVEAGVDFTVAFNAFESESTDPVVGTWTGKEDTGWSTIDYSFVVNADGTGTGSVNYGYYTENFDITFILVNGRTVTFYTVTTGDFGGTAYNYTFTYDPALNALVGETFNLVPSTGDDEGGDAPAGTENDPFVIESLPATLTQGAGHDVWYTFTITEDGTYVLAYPQGCYVEKLPSSAVKDMSARTWTFDATAGTVIKFNVYTSGVNESYEYSLTKFEKPAEPDGTKNNPFIVDAIPYEIKFTGAHDVYVSFTATEAGTYVLTYTNGCYVTDMPSAAVKDSVNCTYTFDMAAGQTLVFNPWKTSGADEYKYTITKYVAPEVDDGGESSADTYYGKGSSRGMRVVIDTAADTLVITRAASGYYDNFDIGSPTTYNLVYSEVLAKATDGVTGAIAGTNISSITFNADGTVEKIVWAGAEYTNFVKQ